MDNKDNRFLSISEAVERLSCSTEHLKNRMLCGQLAIYAQATVPRQGLDGSEQIDAPIFQISVGQLKKILDDYGASIDPDVHLGHNGFCWPFEPPRQVRIEVGDLRIVIPNCKVGTGSEVVAQEDSGNLPSTNSNNKFNVDAYLEENKNATVAEKVYSLRTNTTLTGNKIGELLNVSHNTKGCKSRKVTVSKIFKKEAERLGTWEQVKRK